MTNNTINIDIDALTEDFKAHCKVIKLGCEYPGYTGNEKYGIISDLSYEQITERYAPIVECYLPFVLLSKDMGEVFAEFNRNEDKFYKRMRRDDVYGFEDGTTERYNIKCCVPDFAEALFRECFPQQLVEKAFALLMQECRSITRTNNAPLSIRWQRTKRNSPALNRRALT